MINVVRLSLRYIHRGTQMIFWGGYSLTLIWRQIQLVVIKITRCQMSHPKTLCVCLCVISIMIKLLQMLMGIVRGNNFFAFVIWSWIKIYSYRRNFVYFVKSLTRH